HAHGAEAVHAPDLARVDAGGGVPPLHLARDADHPLLVLLEGGDLADAGAAFHDGLPHRRTSMPMSVTAPRPVTTTRLLLPLLLIGELSRTSLGLPRRGGGSATPVRLRRQCSA